MTIAVDLGRKATHQTNNHTTISEANMYNLLGKGFYSNYKQILISIQRVCCILVRCLFISKDF